MRRTPSGFEQFRAIRHRFLGRPLALDVSTYSPDEEWVLREWKNLKKTRDLVPLLQTWAASPEFGQTWNRNDLFDTFQGIESLIEAPQVRTLIHVHIPKTAGISLAETLKDQLYDPANPAVQVLCSEPMDHLFRLPLAQLLQLRFISGHFGMTMANLLAPRNPFVFTIVREPVSMYASWWRYHASKGLVSLGFDEWLEDPGTPDNIQAIYLAYDLLRDGWRVPAWPVDVVPDWIPRLDVTLPAAHIDLDQEAKSALARMDLVAPLEKIDELYTRLGTIDGIDLDTSIPLPRLNATTMQPVSNHARSVIEAKTSLDAELYETCCTSWDAQ